MNECKFSLGSGLLSYVDIMGRMNLLSVIMITDLSSIVMFSDSLSDSGWPTKMNTFFRCQYIGAIYSKIVHSYATLTTGDHNKGSHGILDIPITFYPLD